MPIKVSIDTTKAISGLREIQQKQIPYALARTLTATARDEQALIRESLGSKFTLRNQFTSQGIRFKPASKNGVRIEADVHTDTANRTTGAPGYMARQEEGGERVPVQGRQHIAIPTQYLRRMAPAAIPAELRPAALLSIAANGGKFMTTTRRTREKVLRNTQRVRGFVFFLQQLKDGRSALMGRYMTEEDAYPFYLLIPDAMIRPRLGMGELVSRSAPGLFEKNWAETWRGIMAQGLRVRF